jgi:hypothetical protein
VAWQSTRPWAKANTQTAAGIPKKVVKYLTLRDLLTVISEFIMARVRFLFPQSPLSLFAENVA